MIVYLDGKFLPSEEARVSPFDRAYLLGDALYEGLRAEEGVVIGLEPHIQRLQRGLEQVHITGFDARVIPDICSRLIEANDARDGFLYIQVSRGTPRPGAPLRGRIGKGLGDPVVFAYAEPLAPVRDMTAPHLVTARTVEDRRWSMGHIKTTSQMGSVVGAYESLKQGADESIFIRGDLVAEASATNIFALVDGTLVTPDLASTSILPGVTRDMLLRADPSIVERPLTLEELLRADEVMLAGTRTLIAQVTHINGNTLGDAATPGPRSLELLQTLIRAVHDDVHCRHG